VVEFAGDDFGLAGVIVKVLLLAGDFEMAAAGEIAGDGFFFHNLLYAVDGGERGGVHALGAFAAILGDELVDAQLHAGEDHASVAGAGAPSDGFGFQDGYFGAALGERVRGGESGESCADYGYVGRFR